MGEEPALDSYLTLRRDARTPELEKELAVMYTMVGDVIKVVTREGIDPDTVKTNKEHPLPQEFYDLVARNKNHKNPFQDGELKKKTGASLKK